MTGAGRGFCAGADMNAVFGTRLAEPTRATTPPADPEVCRRASTGCSWSVSRSRSSRRSTGRRSGSGSRWSSRPTRSSATADAKIGVVVHQGRTRARTGSTHFLVQRVGWGAASDLCLTGRIVRGDEAAALRLVDHVVDDHDALIAKATELAEAFAASPTPQARMVKQLLTVNGAETDLRRRPTSRESAVGRVLVNARARRGRRGVHGEASAAVPLNQRRTAGRSADLENGRRREPSEPAWRSADLVRRDETPCEAEPIVTAGRSAGGVRTPRRSSGRRGPSSPRSGRRRPAVRAGP